MSNICIEAQNLKIQFPLKRKMFQERKYLKAVDGVSFAIEQGTTMGLVGESGCGKTTVGRALLRLYDIEEGGKILFDGTDISRLNDKQMRPYRKKMQMIFQDPYTSLDPRKTIGTIIREPLISLGLMEGKDAQDRVEELIDMVGLKRDHLNRYPHEFSGGQRQRIGIARALAANPEFIVCDEPISALDVSIQAQVVNLLEKLQHELGLTYLFIAHDLAMVRYISQKVAVMYLGQIVELADTEDLYTNPLHPYTKALLSSIPLPDPQKEKHKQRIILQGELPSPLNPPKGCPFNTRCPKAKEICRQKLPEMKMINNRYVRCHLYDE